MDEIALGKKQYAGVNAQLLLENETLKSSFAQLRADYLAEWENTPAKAIEVRERLWTAVRTLGLVEHHLRKLISDGKIATKDLASIKYLKR